jgi:2-desacetyl-2-hydroxyethyl bacteriochlorophyllide A dehydrogenase
MRTVILERPGLLRTADTSPPGDPGPGAALVRVRHVGVCGTDTHAWHGRQPFFTFPRILGHELGVEVLATGQGVTDVQPGDRCAVEPYLDCGICSACCQGRGNCCERLQVLGVHTDGGMRELIQVPAAKLHPSPSLDLEQLALVETICIGAHAVKRAAIQAGMRLLVLGAGPIGLGVAEVARGRGAEVTLADVNAKRLAFARDQAGFRQTLAVGTDGLDTAVRQAFGGELPALVVDATGNARSMESAFGLVAHAGTLVFVGLVQSVISFHDPDLHRRELTVLASRNALPADFARVITAMETGRIDVRPWITHRAALEDVPAQFAGWAEPSSGVVKAVIEIET